MRLHRPVTFFFFMLFSTGFLAPVVLAVQITGQQDSTIKIGLLIEDNNSFAARHGAELAIIKANETGGYKGKKFQLVVRSMEGPWGTGSKQAVDLIFDEKVAAIMGSHDGRNAHLVEQVTTKARIVFLSCWAGDPTLSQAFVPWFFTCVPNDHQQADAYIEEIYDRRKLNRVALISDNNYESLSGVNSLVKKIGSSGKSLPLQIIYDNPEKEFGAIVDQLDKAKPDCIIMFGKPGPSAQILELLDKRKIKLLVYGALSLLNEDEITESQIKYLDHAQYICSGISSESDAFRNDYQKLFGKSPGPVAAYSYDGMNILIEAIKKAGLDRENIQKAIAEMRYEGATGLIRFDEKGKRIGKPRLMAIENGVPVIPDK
jgi:branched-chain amino acid transport system substrate-binding protein